MVETVVHTVRVGGAILGEVRAKPRTGKGRPNLLVIRFREARRLLHDRWRGAVPLLDDPDTQSHLLVLADLAAQAERHRASSVPVAKRVENIVAGICPDLAGDVEALAEVVDLALDLPRKWSAQELGDALGLTPEEREAAKITQFRPAGLGSDENFKNFQRECATKRQRRSRARRKAEEGVMATSVAEEIAEFKAATGLSRRSFYNWAKAGRDWRAEAAQKVSRAYKYNACDAVCATRPRARSAPDTASEERARRALLALAHLVARATGVAPVGGEIRAGTVTLHLPAAAAAHVAAIAGHAEIELARLGIGSTCWPGACCIKVGGFVPFDARGTAVFRRSA